MKLRIKAPRRPGARALFETEGSESGRLLLTSLKQFRSALGDDMLADFLRAFLWTDRLVALAMAMKAAIARENADGKIPVERDRLSYWVLTCGCLYELARALEDLKHDGIAGLMRRPADSSVLAQIDAFIDRWQRPGPRKAVRDQIAFHIDRPVLLEGIEYTQVNLGDGPHVFIEGPSKKRLAMMFRMAHGVMFEGLFRSIKETLPAAQRNSMIETLIVSTTDDHGEIEKVVTSLFFAVVEGLAAGRKPVPISAPKAIGAKQRLALVGQTTRRLGKELLAADFDSTADVQSQVEALGRALKATQRELRECQRALERARSK